MVSFSVEMSMPYSTEESLGIGGRLRAKPEHFEVHEIPLYAAEGAGEHLYVNLTKVNQTTKQVQGQLARLFSIRPQDVGFAGLKDKYAKTSQTFSIFCGRQQPVVVPRGGLAHHDLGMVITNRLVVRQLKV